LVAAKAWVSLYPKTGFIIHTMLPADVKRGATHFAKEPQNTRHSRQPVMRALCAKWNLKHEQ